MTLLQSKSHNSHSVQAKLFISYLSHEWESQRDGNISLRRPNSLQKIMLKKTCKDKKLMLYKAIQL